MLLGVGLPRCFSVRRARRRVVCDSKRLTVEKIRERNPLWRGPDTMSGGSLLRSVPSRMQYIGGGQVYKGSRVRLTT